MAPARQARTLSSGTYRAQKASRRAAVGDVVQAPAPPGLSWGTSTGRACQVTAAPFLLLQGPEEGPWHRG